MPNPAETQRRERVTKVKKGHEKQRRVIIGGARNVRMGRNRSALLAPDADFSDWDDEEILRGRRRDKNGGWGGRPPLVVPTAVHQEVTRRKIRAAEAMLKDSLEEAVQMLRDVMNGEDVDPGVRLRAANIIIERVMGKTPERIEVHATETPFETSLSKVFMDRSRVLDADSWEADDEVEEVG